MEVTCLDENDTPPYFEEGVVLTLSEAFLPGQHLATVAATDKDLDPSLRYSLDLPTQAFMAINEASGALRLVQSIDREEYEYFQVTVFVTDGIHTTNWTRRLEESRKQTKLINFNSIQLFIKLINLYYNC